MDEHSTSYADACQPPRWRILRLNLCDFSIGHMLCLLKIRSPIVCGGEIKSTHLAEAVWICSMPYEKAVKMLNRPLSWRRILWALKLEIIFALREDVLKAKIAEFSKYIVESSLPVSVWTIGTGTRTSSTPAMLGYKRALMSHFGYSESRVLNMPFRQAVYEACAYSENEGAVEFMNGDDKEYLQKAKAAIEKAKRK